MAAPSVEPAAWPSYLGGLRRAPSAFETVPDTLVEHWSANVGAAVTGAIAIGDSMVVAQTSNRVLTALRVRSGETVWRARIGGPGAAGPTFEDGAVYVASGDSRGRVYRYDLYRGRREWSRAVGPVSGPLGFSAGFVTAATAGGSVFAIRRSNGEVAWKRDLRRPIRSGVTVVGDLTLVATEDSLFALAHDGGAVVARAPLDQAVLRPPAIAGNLVVIVTPDGDVTAFDAPNLSKRWTHHLHEAVFGSPAIARDTVFVTTIDGALWRIPLGDPQGASAMRIDDPMRAGPAPVVHGVILATISGRVLLVGNDVASPAWETDVDGPVDEPPIVKDGRVYVVDGRGRVIQFAKPEAR